MGSEICLPHPLLCPPRHPPPTWDPAQEGGGEGSGGWPSWELRVGHGQPPRVGMPGRAWPSIYLPCLFLSSYTNPPLLKKKRERSEGATNHVAESRCLSSVVGVTSKPPNSKFPLPRPFRDGEIPPLPNQGQPWWGESSSPVPFTPAQETEQVFSFSLTALL